MVDKPFFISLVRNTIADGQRPPLRMTNLLPYIGYSPVKHPSQKLQLAVAFGVIFLRFSRLK